MNGRKIGLLTDGRGQKINRHPRALLHPGCERGGWTVDGERGMIKQEEIPRSGRCALADQIPTAVHLNGEIGFNNLGTAVVGKHERCLDGKLPACFDSFVVDAIVS